MIQFLRVALFDIWQPGDIILFSMDALCPMVHFSPIKQLLDIYVVLGMETRLKMILLKFLVTNFS